MITGGELHVADAVTSAVYGISTGGGIIAGMRFFQWLAGFRAGRLDKQQEHVDDAVRELITGLRAEIDRLKSDRDADRNRMSEMEEQLRHCNEQHAEARAEVMELRAMLQGYGNVRDEAQKYLALQHKIEKENNDVR